MPLNEPDRDPGRLPRRATGLFLIALVLLPWLTGCGCGYRPASQRTDADNRPEATPAVDRPVTTSARPGVRPVGAPSGPASASGRLAQVEARLQEAAAMMKAANLEGALRLVDRIHQEEGRDPYVSMQTWYLKAMIYHRQKDSPKRKDAMNAMLKSMETMQKDPRFRQSFEDGQEVADVIKTSVQRAQKAGKNYGP